jgi:hypothetical protein
MFDLSFFLFFAAMVSIALYSLNQRVVSPTLAILNRWLRWIIFSVSTAFLCEGLEWIDRPFWVLCLIFFLVWFLLETLYNWLLISAHSQSGLPLFPRYSVNASGEEWPTQPRLLTVRSWLRAHKFTQVQALRAEVGSGVYLRVSVYQDAAATTRIQVTFLPQANGAVAVCYALSSQTAAGLRYLTDNLYLPFGGFYPENWLVLRQPLTRRLEKLVTVHHRRLAAAGEALVPWETEPLADLNLQQSQLEQVNTELGFLFPYHQREEYGKITHEGRYRVWKEIWLLNYFGRSGSH